MKKKKRGEIKRKFKVKRENESQRDRNENPRYLTVLIWFCVFSSDSEKSDKKSSSKKEEKKKKVMPGPVHIGTSEPVILLELDPQVLDNSVSRKNIKVGHRTSRENYGGLENHPTKSCSKKGRVGLFAGFLPLDETMSYIF
jgi:hypothetical protein